MVNTKTFVIDFGTCPECGEHFEFDVDDPTWTESKDLIVIALICPRCEYTGAAHIFHKNEVNDGRH